MKHRWWKYSVKEEWRLECMEVHAGWSVARVEKDATKKKLFVSILRWTAT
jgi:hypothetical protein